jgi:hypothetical protein
LDEHILPYIMPNGKVTICNGESKGQLSTLGNTSSPLNIHSTNSDCDVEFTGGGAIEGRGLFAQDAKEGVGVLVLDIEGGGVKVTLLPLLPQALRILPLLWT